MTQNCRRSRKATRHRPLGVGRNPKREKVTEQCVNVLFVIWEEQETFCFDLPKMLNTKHSSV